jgi:3-phosphoshikimate 1-carboxyvinyltransferase
MMTLAQMQHFGIQSKFDINTQNIIIPPQKYQMQDFSVENDWSAVSYWYLVASLCPDKTFIINGLKKKSLQGDSKIVEIMQLFGVETTFLENGIEIKQIPDFKIKDNASNYLFIDFSDCPDLAQTIVALCTIKRITLKMRGLESLIIKETNRIEALNNEINKIGCKLCKEDDYWYVKPIIDFKGDFSNIIFNTYDDHRMAMAFAPLALVLDNISIENPSVVKKSYPNFWEELGKIIFLTTLSTSIYKK